MSKNRYPNFLIIGAAKAGTTALYEYLAQHPEISLTTPKEPHYFAFNGTRPCLVDAYGQVAPVARTSIVDTASYLQLFEGMQATAVGEASTSYLYWPGSAKRIHRFNPEMKLIALLRNPIERAFSSYLHLKRELREPLTFVEGLRAESDRIRGNIGFLWRYVDMGRYCRQLGPYFELFPASQIHIVMSDDLRYRTREVLNQVFQFLEVTENVFVDASTLHNVSGQPKSRVAQGFVLWMQRSRWTKAVARSILPETLQRTILDKVQAANLQRPDLPIDAGEFLRDRFAEEVGDLGTLLGQDLSRWLEK